MKSCQIAPEIVAAGAPLSEVTSSSSPEHFEKDSSGFDYNMMWSGWITYLGYHNLCGTTFHSAPACVSRGCVTCDFPIGTSASMLSHLTQQHLQRVT